jgi:hypothetical protein
MRHPLWALLAATSLLLADAPTGGAPSLAAHIANGLAAHRILYQLTLESARTGDVTAATGTMTYEVLDACDGWAVQQRLEMALTNRDGQDIQMVSDYATWEAKNGLKLRFRMRQNTESATTQVTSGEAVLESVGGKGEIHYDKPTPATRPLPAGTLFPMWHTANILAAAEQGKKFLSLPLFDGTTDTGAQDTFVVIVNWNKPQPFPISTLAKLPSGRVHVAFFDHSRVNLLPDYEVGMRYWENGVADNLRMDFGDFVMDGKLAQFKMEPPRRC